jgi:hypothetical protein
LYNNVSNAKKSWSLLFMVVNAPTLCCAGYKKNRAKSLVVSFLMNAFGKKGKGAYDAKQENS